MHRLLTALPLLDEQLRVMKGEGKEVMVVFPDEGASKRFKSDLGSWPAITCVKVREGDSKRKVTIKHGQWCSGYFIYVKSCAGDPRGWHVVIVDDLVQTGGTIMECAKV